MFTRVVLTALLLAAAPAAAIAAAPHRHGTAGGPPRHHAARVSIATYRTNGAHKPVRDLRAHHGHPARTRLASVQTRHHPLSRGS